MDNQLCVIGDFHQGFQDPPQNKCMVIWVPLHFSCTGCQCCITSECSCSTLHFRGFSSSSHSITIHRTHRTASRNMSADSNTSHLQPETKRHRKPIWHSPAGYVHCMSFNSSRWISMFQFVTHAAAVSMEPCSAGTMCSRLRKRLLLKTATVKLTFCNSDIVCVHSNISLQLHNS